MSAEEDNRAIVQRFIEELWNGGNLGVADEIFAADCVTHQLRSGSEDVAAPRDPETLKNHVAEWLKGFPDLRFKVEQMLAVEDRVVSQIVAEGTHSGDWQGIAPTNKRVSLRMVTIHRIRDGRIVEDWVLVEALGFYQQLGLMPSVQEMLSKSAK